MATFDTTQAKLDVISPTLRDTSAASLGHYYIQNVYTVYADDSTTAAAKPVVIGTKQIITLGP